jgi:hypothetical protein
MLLKGAAFPRIAPPVPAVSLVDSWTENAHALGITPMEWQTLVARYLNARGPNGHWLFREIALVASRQNGKTEILKPHVRQRMRMGRRILHTAQNRELPRQTFLEIAADMYDDPAVKSIREANGQESITLHAEGCVRPKGRKRCKCKGGGKYTLVAPRPGVRGHGVDDVILDEVREQRSYELIGAIKPTVTAADDWQIVYLSNAGDESSVVLNDLKRRGERGSERLAYIEFSASPERSIDDRAGWAEANPSLGQTITLETLEDFFESLPAAQFETEHLCRWVASMQPKLVSDAAWMNCRAVLEDDPVKPAIAFNMDPSGKRASAVMAWQMTDGRIACVELSEAIGDPIDLPSYGAALKDMASKHGAKRLAFASWTDKDLARYVPRATALDGKEFANASENFARLVLSGRLAWDGAAHITDDLSWTARKPHDSGAWMAVPATPERSVTAVLAAIRAVWLASAPRTVPRIG